MNKNFKKFLAIFAIFIFLVSFAPSSVFAQTIEWETQLGQVFPSGEDKDGSGNIYVVGNLLDSSDAVILKANTNGNILWTRQFDVFTSPLANTEVSDISVAGSGDTFIVGEAAYSSPGYPDDAFLRKYDSDGNALWTRQFGFGEDVNAPGWASTDQAKAVAIDISGNIYVGGLTSGTVPGQTNYGGIDAFLRKYDSDGNALWTRQFGTPTAPFQSDIVKRIVVDNLGQIYLLAHLGANKFLIKLDPSGNQLWTRQFIYETLNDLVVDQSRNLYVGGRNSLGVAFLGAYNDNGDELWTREIGTPNPANDTLFDIQSVTTENGKIAVGGYAYAALPGQSYIGPGTDTFVRVYDFGGNEVWTHEFIGDQVPGLVFSESDSLVTSITSPNRIIKVSPQMPNQSPTANAGSDQTVNEGQQITFDGSGSTDPNGIGDIVSYAWNFGDGGTGTGVSPIHTYTDNGIYTVSLTVTDTQGESNIDTTTITVNNVSPTAAFSISPQTIIRGQSSTVSFSNQYDPGSVDTLTGFTYSYDCTNDGIFDLNDSTSILFACSYPNSGLYTVIGRIKDKDGGYSEYSAFITVQTPAEATQGLTNVVETFNLQQGIENSLDAKLNTALNALNDINQNNNQAAINSLQSFINAVEAQRGNQITNEQADTLIAAAQAIINSLL